MILMEEITQECLHTGALGVAAHDDVAVGGVVVVPVLRKPAVVLYHLRGLSERQAER